MAKNELSIKFKPTDKQRATWKYLLDGKTKFIFFGGGAGGGKAQPLTSKVLTPKGFKLMGDIVIGDKVLTPNNTMSKVIAIHPQGYQDIYELKFSDGSIIETTKEHLFECWISGRGQKSRKVRSVKEILKLKQKIIIPLSEKLEFGKHYDKVDSYLIGALLGDGGLTKNNIVFTTEDKEILSYFKIGDNVINDKRNYRYTITSNKRNSKGYPYNNLMTELNKLGMMGVKTINKKIPKEIKFGSLKNRLECLQGLMDTDGTSDSRGHPSFCSISKQLAKDVQYIARSLGCKATLTSGIKFCYYKNKKRECKAYNVYIRSNNDKDLFKLKRKRNRCKKFNGGNSELGRRLISIKNVRKDKAQCITISNSNGLYISDDFIVTHNSWLGCEWLLYLCISHPGVKLFIGRNELTRLMESTYVTWLKVCHFHKIPKHIWKFNGSRNMIEFINFQTGQFDENGSKINLLNVEYRPRDPLYERFGSSEYTAGFLEEVGEIKEKAFDVLKSRIGRHQPYNSYVSPKIYLTGNPKKNWTYYLFYKQHKERVNDDGVTFDMVIDPQRPNITFNSAFIQALYNDNPHTQREYEQNLLSIRDKILRERLMNGNWEYDDNDSSLYAYEDILNIFTRLYDTDLGSTNYITVDVARSGNDKAVIMLWQGMYVKKVWFEDKSNIIHFGDKIMSKAAQHRVSRDHIVIDEDGVGGGLVDYVEGSIGFVNGSSPVEDFSEDLQETKRYSYINLRSQCYFELAKFISTRSIGVSPDVSEEVRNSLIEELEVIKRKDHERNEKKLQVIPKDEIKEVLGRSPDFADTMMMRMIFELGLQSNQDIDVVW